MALRAICKITDRLVRLRKVYGPYMKVYEAQLRAIHLPRSDQPVRKLAFCPKGYVVFFILYRIYFRSSLLLLSNNNFICSVCEISQTLDGCVYYFQTMPQKPFFFF